MLTDTALKNLKPKDAPYKVTDRDGMYVTVSTAGTVTFRYDYRINSRRETLTMGRQRGTRESGSAHRYGSMRHRNGTVLSITSLGAPRL